MEQGIDETNAVLKDLDIKAKRQLKKLARKQNKKIVICQFDVNANVAASAPANKKKRKQRHRLLFRLRQSNITAVFFCIYLFIECLKIWARLFILAFSRTESKKPSKYKPKQCRHYALRKSN
jgi:mRNA-degrading endonuclease RelE of RelBE toxin-antitoxin system